LFRRPDNQYILTYKIIDNPVYTTVINVGIETHPDDDVLKLFLSGTYIKKLPEAIEKISQSKGYRQEFIGVSFFEQMDWEDKALLERFGGIKEGEVAIDLYDGSKKYSVLAEDLFDKILFDYSLKVLEVYNGSDSVPANWNIEMKEALVKLGAKISRRRP
jgi:hypothetical protein